MRPTTWGRRCWLQNESAFMTVQEKKVVLITDVFSSVGLAAAILLSRSGHRVFGAVKASRMTKLKGPTYSDATKSETRFSAFAVLALVAFLLVGCAVGPRYKGTTTKIQPFHSAP